MSFPRRLAPHLWIFVLLCTGGFLVWANAVRARRVEFISGLADPATTVDVASPTGYAAGWRRLIVPEHNNASYQWIAQTQQMLARGEWHVRHVDYDNAPVGREVRSPSLYRWWLGLVAWTGQVLTGRSPGQSVEWASLFADPCLHLLLLVSAAGFAARCFGAFPAALLTVGLAVAFPFAGAFLPGQPNDHGLVQVAAFWSVLPLVAGIFRRNTAVQLPGGTAPVTRRDRWLFCSAGLAGGIGLWVNVSSQLPLLAGIFLGAIATVWFARRPATDRPVAAVPPVLWRTWALSGGGTVLAAYLIEFFPAHMGSLRLEGVHPLYGLVWLGAGELLAQFAVGVAPTRAAWSRVVTTVAGLAALAAAAVPAWMMVASGRGLLVDENLASRLTDLPESVVAPNLWAWLQRDGISLAGWATCLPLLLLLIAVAWRLGHRATDSRHRAALCLALGPVLIALGLACFRLRWWNLLDGALLALLVAAAAVPFATAPRLGRGLWSAGAVLGLIPGLLLLVAQVRRDAGEVVTEGDAEALIERDLAHWLSNQAGPGGAVVLAPPNLTTSLYFHGGLSGLGTPYWENKDGFAAAVRIAGATSPDEAQAVARGRDLAYVVVPSWDGFLDEYARLGSGQADHSLIALLHHWLPPRWLQPVPYNLPAMAGFEGRSVVIFKVVDVQDQANALGHLAEYFIDLRQLDQATTVEFALERFAPNDLAALATRALVEKARGDAAGLAKVVAEMQPYLARGDDRALAWDRRVSLAVALVDGKRFESARAQVQRCLADLDEPRLRSLSTMALYRLQVMSKAFGLGIADQRLRELARRLLPAEMRENL